LNLTMRKYRRLWNKSLSQGFFLHQGSEEESGSTVAFKIRIMLNLSNIKMLIEKAGYLLSGKVVPC
jgi:hypothetical protein